MAKILALATIASIAAFDTAAATQKSCALTDFTAEKTQFLLLNNVIDVVTQSTLLSTYVEDYDPFVVQDINLGGFSYSVLGQDLTFTPTVDKLNVTGLRDITPEHVNASTSNCVDFGAHWNGGVVIEATVSLTLEEIDTSITVEVSLTLENPTLAVDVQANMFKCADGAADCDPFTITSIEVAGVDGKISEIMDSLLLRFKDAVVQTLAVNFASIKDSNFRFKSSGPIISALTDALADFSADEINKKGGAYDTFTSKISDQLLSVANDYIESNLQPKFVFLFELHVSHDKVSPGISLLRLSRELKLDSEVSKHKTWQPLNSLPMIGAMKVIETDTVEVQVDSAGTTSLVNEYKILAMLGEGTFSKVYLCQKDDGVEFALKIINKSILKRKREYKRVDGKLVLSNAFQKVQKEVAIMKKLAHSNLVRLYEVIDSPADDKLFLVLELIRGGQVMNWDDKNFRYFSRYSPNGTLDEETVRRCMRDMVAALDYLHRNRICHRDIKPENILLSSSEYKLADFGVAYMNEDEQTARLRSTEGTYHFLAPECTTGEEYDPYQVDIWALGVTMFTLLVGTLPFGTGVVSLDDVMTSIREDPLHLPAELGPECSELLNRLMEKNPCSRITLQQLKTHPWITGICGSAEAFRRIPSNAKVLVTQQEIDDAFTPVNNFILMSKLKIKMSSRLTTARKSLAENIIRGDEAVSGTSHALISSSELSAVRDNCDGNTRVQESTLVPSQHVASNLSPECSSPMSGTIDSITTTITRRKSHLEAVSLEADTARLAVSPAPSKAEISCKPSILSRSLMRHKSQSTRALIASTETTRGVNSAGQKDFVNVEARHHLSPDKADSVFGLSLQKSTMTSLDENKGTEAVDPTGLLSQRMTKRKSTSFRGIIRTADLTKYAAESGSPISKRKKGAKRDPNTTNIDDEARDPSDLRLGRRLSRRTSASSRALVLTELPGEDGAPVDAENLRNTAALGTLLIERNDASSTENSPCTADWASNTNNTIPAISSLQDDSGNSSTSPKLKITIPTDEQPPRKTQLPTLDVRMSPVSSPGTSPISPSRIAADICEQEAFSSCSTPRRRTSSPPKIIPPVRFFSTLEVPTLQPPNANAPGLESKKEPRDSTRHGEGETTPRALSIDTAMGVASTFPLDPSGRHLAESPIARSGSPSRRATIVALPDQERSPQSRSRRLHRNRSMSDDDDLNNTFARTTSLAKVLDECLGSSSARFRQNQPAISSGIATSPEIHVLSVPTTPTNHQVPILHNENAVCQADGKSKEKSPRVEDGSQQIQVLPLACARKSDPILSADTSTPDTSRLRRRSLVEAPDSLRVLFRGRRLSVFGEKREPICTTTEDATTATKAKVCTVM